MPSQPWANLPDPSRGGTGMRASAPGGAAVDACLGPADIMEQVETAVVVTDRGCTLLYANAFAATLFGFPDPPARLVGRSLVSLGLEEGDARRVNDLAAQVLRGRVWEGTFASRQADGSRLFVRAQAVPLRPASPEISGIALLAREARPPGQQHARAPIRLLPRPAQRLAPTPAL